MKTLILGGIRSGKSRYAHQRGLEYGGSVTVIATALPSDEEMAQRIAAHQVHRPKDWVVVDSFDDETASTLAMSDAGTVIIDSLDTLLYNHLEAQGGVDAVEALRRSDPPLAPLVGRISRVANHCRHLLIVSNEVGLSLVSATPYGRLFCELLGTLNQEMAHDADETILMVAGLPLPLSRLAAATSVTHPPLALP